MGEYSIAHIYPKQPATGVAQALPSSCHPSRPTYRQPGANSLADQLALLQNSTMIKVAASQEIMHVLGKHSCEDDPLGNGLSADRRCGLLDDSKKTLQRHVGAMAEVADGAEKACRRWSRTLESWFWKSTRWAQLLRQCETVRRIPG
jgi:hypothetical protein